MTCWGDNEHGELGLGHTDPVTGRMDVPGLPSITQVSVDDLHTVAVDEAGDVWFWGLWQGAGCAGREVRSTPERVSGLDDVVRVTAGSRHSCALTASGRVWCWGCNSSGESGVESVAAYVDPPEQVLGLRGSVLEVDAGDRFTCALRDDLQVLCWGADDRGQLGDGSAGGERHVPVTVDVVSDVEEVSAGGRTACARRLDDSVLCWGDNEWGQIGASAAGDMTATPLAVEHLPDAEELSVGRRGVCARRTSGQVSCWGGAPGRWPSYPLTGIY
ncbi:MAG: RCC1 domain-containing protein [Polyangiales bacterium]